MKSLEQNIFPLHTYNDIHLYGKIASEELTNIFYSFHNLHTTVNDTIRNIAI